MKKIWVRNTSLALACMALGVPLMVEAPGAASSTPEATTTVPYPMLGTNLTTEYVAAGTQPSDTVMVTDDVNDVVGAAVTMYMWGPLQAPVTGDCSALSLAQFNAKSPGLGTYTDMILNLTGLWLSGNGSYTALGPVAITSACYGWTSVETFPEVDTTTTTSTVPPTTTTTTTTPTPKITTITCVRGKTSKRVAAVSPACPRGYKKIRIVTCVRGKITKKVTGVGPTCPRGYKVKKTNPPITATKTISTQVAGLASCGDCGAAALINADRASVGLPPLIVTENDPSVELSALLFVSSADDPGNAAWRINPNLTARQAAALAVSEWWAEGPGPFGEAHGHYDNIANPNARYLSVSVAFQPAGTPAGPGWVVNASF